MFWVLLGTVAVLLIFWELQFRWKYRSILKLPGAFEIPLIGSAPMLFSKPKKMNNDILNIVKTYGPIARFSLYHTMHIVIADPEMLEFVFRSPSTMARGNLYLFMKRWLGDGLFLSTGEQYYHLRKHELILFSYMHETLEELEQHSNILVDILNKKIDNNKPVDVYPLIIDYAVDVVTELITGESLNAQRNQYQDYCKAMNFMSSLPLRRTVSFWRKFDFLYKISPLYQQEIKHLKIINDVSLQAMENRKKVNAPNALSTSTNKKRKVPIDFFFKLAAENITPQETIKTDLNASIWVSHDSTATTISIMIYHLANNKDIQVKIVEELKLIFENDRDRPATMQDLTEMKYMELVIKEILRFYGVLSVISRTATEDIEFKGIRIPKGTQLLLSIQGVHKSNHFEKPEEFNPERFLPGNPITPYSYIPFSAGTRSCLGQRYSMYKIKTTFAKLLRHFEFETAGPDHKLEFCSNLVSKPIHGMYVNIKPRKF